MKVLYIEDQAVNVLLMQALFALRPKLELRVATTGEAGRQAALEDPPDLLLIDLRLPDCHGTQLLESLRACPSLSKIPAAAVTAEPPNLQGTSFLEVWPKPLDITETLTRLDRLHLEIQGQHESEAHRS